MRQDDLDPARDAPDRNGPASRSHDGPAQPALVRPYARLPARMVEAPVTLTRSVLDALARPGEETVSDRGGTGEGRRGGPFRSAVVGGVAAGLVLVLAAVIAHQAGLWPFGAARPEAKSPASLTPVAPQEPSDSAPGTPDPDDSPSGKESPSPDRPSKSPGKPSGSPSRSAHPGRSPDPTYTGGAGNVGAVPQEGDRGCRASWQVDSQWEHFTATIRVINTSGAEIRGWTVGWTWPAEQKVVDRWNATFQQSGRNVTATNDRTHGTITATGETTFGFEATGSGTPAPLLSCWAR
ncbi:cellulose binding domain-containing protein [Streptomyces sp. NPDC047108]|uniref:cellulose binding domain-containing protein n=1 Tax=Streptomyces sp. NPDC047108 TaxID=3155025 RepID=UPI003409227F